MTIKNSLILIMVAILAFSCGVRKAQTAQTKVQPAPAPKVEPHENILEEPPAPAAVPPPAMDEKAEIFVVVEDMPRFPGCEETSGSSSDKRQCANKLMLEYIYANIQYPEQAKKEGKEGTCIVSFIVSKSGRIKNAKVLRDPGAGLGEEALRIVNSMNENDILWIPGKQRGRPVDVRFNLPVKFKHPGN